MPVSLGQWEAIVLMQQGDMGYLDLDFIHSFCKHGLHAWQVGSTGNTAVSIESHPGLPEFTTEQGRQA